MADAPWRCSQCGTINEPVANSCRTCGKWPSLFDIQDSVVDDVAREDAREPAPSSPTYDDAPFEPDVVEPDVVEPDALEPEAFDAEPYEPGPAADPYELERPDREQEPAEPRRRQWLGRLAVPIVFALIVLVNALFGNR